MQQTSVLALPDFQCPFVVETNTYDLDVGAILMQHENPIDFLSNALSEKHRHISIYEKEFLTLFMAVEKWWSYLQCREFTIRTDHKSLAYISEQNLHSAFNGKQ